MKHEYLLQKCLLTLHLILCASAFAALHAASFYVDPAGNNASAGTSTAAAWKDFTNVNSHIFQPGDSILLKRGSTWNQRFDLYGAGSAAQWITVDAYGTGARPVIQLNNQKTDRCMWVHGGSYIVVNNMEMCNSGMGLMVIYQSYMHEGLKIDKCYFHDIEQIWRASVDDYTGDEPRQLDYPVWTSNAIQIGYRINDKDSVPGNYPFPARSQYMVKNIVISDCETYKTDPPTIQYRGYMTLADSGTVRDITIKNCFFHDFRSDFQFENLMNMKMIDCRVFNGGMLGQGQGVTATFFYLATDVRIINNFMDTINYSNSNDETMLDLEAWIEKFKIHGNCFANLAGAGFEMLQTGRNGDYMRDNAVRGNTFYKCGTSIYGAVETWQTGNAVKDTIQDNIFSTGTKGVYYFDQPSYIAGMTIGRNDSVPIADIYNSLQGFPVSGTGTTWSAQSSNTAIPSGFTPISTFDVPSATWTVGNAGVSRFDLTPDASSARWVARTWTAPRTGTVNIRGHLCPNDISGSDTLKAAIMVNGSTVWPAANSQQPVVHADSAGMQTGVDAVSVAAGDVVRFAVGTTSSGTAGNRLSWAPSIVYTASIPTSAINRSTPLVPKIEFRCTRNGLLAALTSDGTKGLRMNVYNMNGKMIVRLTSATNRIEWDYRNNSGSRIGTGAYLVKIEVAGRIAQREVMYQ